MPDLAGVFLEALRRGQLLFAVDEQTLFVVLDIELPALGTNFPGHFGPQACVVQRGTEVIEPVEVSRLHSESQEVVGEPLEFRVRQDLDHGRQVLSLELLSAEALPVKREILSGLLAAEIAENDPVQRQFLNLANGVLDLGRVGDVSAPADQLLGWPIGRTPFGGIQGTSQCDRTQTGQGACDKRSS